MSRALAYLDHNILDRMTKGDPDGIFRLLRSASLTPVFSQENLQEIRRSSGYEEEFLKVLESIGAEHLVPLQYEQYQYTGNFSVQQVNPFDAYRSYSETVAPLPDLGYGLTGLLQKFYGGRESESFEQILSGGMSELTQVIKRASQELEGLAELNEHDRLLFQSSLTAALEAARDQNRSLAALLDFDADGTPAVRQFEQATGLGAKVVKNVQPPDVLRKIWNLLERKLPAGHVDLESFFGINCATGRESTVFEKVNAIYHQLNFLGYYRDSQMHRQRRFHASFSDQTHAGLASFCNVLITRDEDLVMKAAAAYEYLSVRTKILHYQVNERV